MYYRTTISTDESVWINFLVHRTEKRSRSTGLKSILLSNQTGKRISGGYQNDFYIWLWCWHDFHRDKQFNTPLIARHAPKARNAFSDKHFRTWGGNHRQEVVWLYNQIFNTDYKLDIMIPGDGPGEPYYDMETYTRKRQVESGELVEYPAIKGHKTSITGHNDYERIQVKPFKKMWDQYPNGIIFDGATRSMLNNMLGEDLFMPGAQNVWVKLGRKFHSEHNNILQLRLVALICCILCKIPVNSPYFTLKFQE